jgi:hypothetical protein
MPFTLFQTILEIANPPIDVTFDNNWMLWQCVLSNHSKYFFEMLTSAPYHCRLSEKHHGIFRFLLGHVERYGSRCYMDNMDRMLAACGCGNPDHSHDNPECVTYTVADEKSVNELLMIVPKPDDIGSQIQLKWTHFSEKCKSVECSKSMSMFSHHDKLILFETGWQLCNKHERPLHPYRIYESVCDICNRLVFPFATECWTCTLVFFNSPLEVEFSPVAKERCLIKYAGKVYQIKKKRCSK